jgi:imidazolonepropionase-like amidohydrolase
MTRILVDQFWSPGLPTTVARKVITVMNGQITAVDDDSGGHDLHVEGTVIPGLVDAHDHLGVDVGDEHAQAVETDMHNMLRGIRTMRCAVEGGITTLRHCGGRRHLQGVLVRGLETGQLIGPRVVGAGGFLCRTGGHAWYDGMQVDGPEEIRRAVRTNKRDGASFIKMMATGGMATAGSDPGRPEFTDDEAIALIDEAHRLGLPVAAHAYGGDGVDQIIGAGVDTIEHGSLMSDAQMQAAIAADVAVVFTTTVIPAYLADPAVPQAVRAKMAPFAEVNHQALQRARQNGLRIGVGTDGLHGNLLGELQSLVRAGYSTVEALTVATAGNASIAGGASRARLEPGQVADIVVVADDPTTDIDALRRIDGVMIGGRWVVEPVAARLARR